MNADTDTSPTPDATLQSITVDYALPRPPAKVWRTLTEPALLGIWLMENDIRPVVGHRFNFRAAPAPGWDGVVHCEVLAEEPHRLFRYSWCSGGDQKEGHPARLDTIVTWTLAPTGSGGTRLRLEHTGFLPTNAGAAQGADWGWRNRFLPKLSQALSTEAP